MNQPRKHHYCPAGYLANFSSPITRDGKLCVTDVKTADKRSSTPNNEGHQRDFYRIDVDSDREDPFILEKEFAKIEGAALCPVRA